MALPKERRSPPIARESRLVGPSAGPPAAGVPGHAAHSMSSAFAAPSSVALGALAPYKALFGLAPAGVGLLQSVQESRYVQVFDLRFRQLMLRRDDRSQYEAASS
jgi:hypothetical protein